MREFSDEEKREVAQQFLNKVEREMRDTTREYLRAQMETEHGRAWLKKADRQSRRFCQLLDSSQRPGIWRLVPRSIKKVLRDRIVRQVHAECPQSAAVFVAFDILHTRPPRPILWFKVWGAMGLLIPRKARLAVFEPAIEDAYADYLTAKASLTSRPERAWLGAVLAWNTFTFGVTALYYGLVGPIAKIGLIAALIKWITSLLWRLR